MAKAIFDIGDLSPDLEQLLARSELINEYFEKEFDLSFSSLILAFLASDDIVSQWFQNYVRQARIDINSMQKERGLDQRIMDDIASANVPRLKSGLRMTTSAKRFLDEADKLRLQSSNLSGDFSQPLDVLHLMAAFIYVPWVHEKDLDRWGFNRNDWSNEFLKLVESLRRKELAFWRDMHRAAFGQRPAV